MRELLGVLQKNSGIASINYAVGSRGKSDSLHVRTRLVHDGEIVDEAARHAGMMPVVIATGEGTGYQIQPSAALSPAYVHAVPGKKVNRFQYFVIRSDRTSALSERDKREIARFFDHLHVLNPRSRMRIVPPE